MDKKRNKKTKGDGAVAEAKSKKEDEGKGKDVPDGGNGKSLVFLEIEKAKKAGMNMLLPSTHIEGISDFHAPVIDYVDLSPDPKEGGDVYYHSESKKFVPTKQGLMKLALCAGIVWHPTETRRSDGMTDRNYVSYRALGGVRTADGSLAWIPGEYDMDLEVIEEELHDQYSKKGKNSNKTGQELQNYIDFCVRRDLLYKRKHKVKLCESGAMTRVIRHLLVGLKAGYTKEELKKPFVVARIIFKPDYSDLQVKKRMLDAGIDSISKVYGTEEAKREILDTFGAVGIKTVGDVKPETEEPAQEPEPEPEPEPGQEDNDLIAHRKADFEVADKVNQIKTLESMAKRKGYDMKQLKKPLDQFVESEREGFFDKLMECADSDLPF